MKKLMILTLLLCLYLQAFSQEYALKQLNNSPRHQEWVQVKYGNRTVHCFVVFPEKSTKTQAVIVIHENRGLTDWVRSCADQMAEAGYLAIAPDLLSQFSENIQQTRDFASSDDARNAIYQLDPDQVTNDLNAVYQYVASIPACNGKISVVGFCWGGTQSFRYATNNPDLKAALVFYGTAPKEQSEIQKINAPVYGFYGGNDERVNATIPDTETAMKKTGKSYAYEIYKGAGHAYMRQGDDPEGNAENKMARDKSWERIRKILGG